MNHIKSIPAYLLALVFAGFGIAYFLKLMPTPDMTGDPLTFMQLFGGSGYMTAIKVFEVIGGLLVIAPRTRAMGLCILAPIAVNILLFELCIAHKPGIGVILVIVTVLAIYFSKDKFKGVLGS